MRCNTQDEVYRALGQLHHLQGATVWYDVIRNPTLKRRTEITAFHDLMKFIFYGAPTAEVVDCIIPELARYARHGHETA